MESRGLLRQQGKSYLCENTSEDPLYLLGSRDAKSSITVPLISHDEMLGTFNVESPKSCCVLMKAILQFFRAILVVTLQRP